MGTIRTLSEIAAALGTLGSFIVGVVALNNGQRILAGAALGLAILVLLPLAWWLSRGRIPRRTHRRFVIGPEEYQLTPFDLQKRSVLQGSVRADGPESFWVVDDDSLRRFERDKSFDAHEIAEDVLNGTFHCGPGLEGGFNLVIENNDEDEEAEVTVSLAIGRR